MKAVWMISKAVGGKFFDGYYGMDSSILDDNQIFDQDNIPYYIDSSFQNIVVGVGEKPSCETVRDILVEQGNLFNFHVDKQ